MKFTWNVCEFIRLILYLYSYLQSPPKLFQQAPQPFNVFLYNCIICAVNSFNISKLITLKHNTCIRHALVTAIFMHVHAVLPRLPCAVCTCYVETHCPLKLNISFYTLYQLHTYFYAFVVPMNVKFNSRHFLLHLSFKGFISNP